jgi:MoxR-like ATPase
MSVAVQEQSISQFRQAFTSACQAIAEVMVGQRETVENCLIAFFSGGHVLLEGLPGLGKTLLVQTITRVLGLSHKRIQFTPDLMPTDILGTNVLLQGDGKGPLITFDKGPIFAHVVLADEINRATPRTQSALLEAMQEHAVTVGGVSHSLPSPFMVIATQNPIEMEGTYPLPEAQLDRFLFKLVVPYPSLGEIMEIAKRTTSGVATPAITPLHSEQIDAMRALVPQVYVSDQVMTYAARIILATQPTHKEATAVVKKYVQYGASPRGIQALVLGAKAKALLDGRAQASREDILCMLIPALRHRLLLNFEAEADQITTLSLLQQIAEAVK